MTEGGNPNPSINMKPNIQPRTHTLNSPTSVIKLERTELATAICRLTNTSDLFFSMGGKESEVTLWYITVRTGLYSHVKRDWLQLAGTYAK